MIERDSDVQSDFTDEASEVGPRWLLILGAILLVVMMLAAAFALGVYFGERDLF